MKRFVGALALLTCGPPDWGDCQDCKDYVACSIKRGEPESRFDSTYGPNGSCWATENSSYNCMLACQSMNNALKASGQGADAGCTFGM
jgi:hypothetical protein